MATKKKNSTGSSKKGETKAINPEPALKALKQKQEERKGEQGATQVKMSNGEFATTKFKVGDQVRLTKVALDELGLQKKEHCYGEVQEFKAQSALDVVAYLKCSDSQIVVYETAWLEKGAFNETYKKALDKAFKNPNHEVSKMIREAMNEGK